ncbi:aldehyde dehydrogenase AldA (plasmid) [Cupriavidus necator N-1]|uniref:Aldehyde dehydrogenase AldA n=1 Tax=Cupriavidus necator (strain ATCC 43291 / DSM 13513 / CCUG 52238 / LMG 8453 / N-1) TaxID=1042878 RepID=F8GYL2_CUPNN|nr:aldehyde dehydrogenase family protein [Cupriavidus necator]AEI82953.1 aldehyde dehydrogenase AldA [Cupriavidus necator N-1]MDX6008741.1 aldehyde dehydrogenase family protein [Cupriavidus necator]
MSRSDQTENHRFPEVNPHTRYDLFIAGEAVPSSGSDSFTCFDPFEETEWGIVPVGTSDDVDRAVRAARAAFPAWAATPVAGRAEILRIFGNLIRENVEELARIQVHENGKTITEMRGATSTLAPLADYVAQLAIADHGTTVQPTLPGHDAWTRPEPIGVIAAIAPWNNPLVLLAWKLFPAIAAGNTVVIKPSEVTPVSTLRLAQLARQAGVPAGVINVVTGAAETGAALVSHPDIDKVAFTGSTATGISIAKVAAARVLPTTLELGGKGPQIVFPEADLARAVPSLLAGLIAGTGQACNAGSRLLVHESLYDEVLERLKLALANVKIGDPLDPKVQVGPLASRAQFAKVTGYFDIAAREQTTKLLYGARVGTEIPEVTRGLFVEPTIYATPDRTSRVRCEEIFGPVGAVISFRSENEAIEVANETEFGLVSGLWTQDVDRVARVSKRLRSGVVWVNTWRAFGINVPFGGVKMSGLGRELGPDLLHEYTQVKSIWLGNGLET